MNTPLRPFRPASACLAALACVTVAVAQIPPALIVPPLDLASNLETAESDAADKHAARKNGTAVQPAVAAAPVVLFRDDFNGTKLSSSDWFLGTWTLGRTRLGNAPVMTGQYARLKFDTFNASNPGKSFRGTEIGTVKTFAPSAGTGIEFEASVRVNAMASGIVTSFFTYTSRTTPAGITYSDEIDFEFLSKQINSSPATSDPVLTTTWNDWDNNTPVYNDPLTYDSASVNVSPLNLAQFNTILIRWLPGKIEWFVNGQLVRATTKAVPDEPTSIRLNFWAPASGWTDAYSSQLGFAKNARQNKTYYYDVDYVEVRSIPAP